MVNQKDTGVLHWLADEWGRNLVRAVEAMADQKPSTQCDAVVRPHMPSEGALYSEQAFSVGPSCTIQVATPELVWRELGTSVLRAAGIDEVGREDALSTFEEILSQTFAGVAQALTTRLGHEVTCAAKSTKDKLPESLTGLSIAIDLPGAEISDLPAFLTASPELIDALLQTEANATAQAAGQRQEAAGLSSISKTFDLLLGVHLPVSISFGKTHLMVKEVLKLTTGSIVELDRQVTEPVDIIVNNCIIARGEVVVVAGNYGVRVKEIVSKEQRYETGARMALRTVR
jgi:flagellar motor switch protein FliN/FliY